MSDAGEKPYTDLGRILVVLPTYNEIDNLERMVKRLRAAAPEVEVLIADDASPDGTGQLADRLAETDDHLRVLHRARKEGLGTAYLESFRWGLDHGYDVLCEMDSDGSHHPEALANLLRALHEADLVIGSRWVPGGRIENWSRGRQLLSRSGNVYARMALGLRLRDATSGFRVFRRATLQGIDLDQVASQGYCFQIDLAWRAYLAGFRVSEVPIVFSEREYGTSKMDRNVLIESFRRVTVWGVRHRVRQVRELVSGKRKAGI
ncbi:polyprenol monophosphomannose synthase [Actinopolymorpha sp. B9G3]|uniref:polyprenol monophosphomannose synthase n=1 Tax=Actinopolymorpha sp. B9G3 TaxID=3158970 RepID=UPI0032D919EE